jgi:DNA-binding winged helix-turn-helix (wHTH) protein/tetratricopeptide (TPR) repeat protein
MEPQISRFRDFEVDYKAQELRHAGAVVDLPVSAFDCLSYLIRHRDRPVGRDELILAVWARPNVSETLLGQTIARLRRELGDTGSEQHSIRTISRKGYRWVAPTVDSSEADPPIERTVRTSGRADVEVARASDAPVDPRRRASTLRAGNRRWMLPLLAALIACAGVVILLRRPSHTPEPRSEITASALVLPSNISAPQEWDWLRLGLMDLIATRLRRGTQETIPSEGVVGYLQNLRRSGKPVAPSLDDGRLDEISRLRIQPTASLVAGEWQVVLEVLDHDAAFRVDARNTDILAAGRQAADLLLMRLGKPVPPATSEDPPAGVADIVQRAKAATLAGKLDLARSIIDSAPSDIRASPEIAWSLALIDANSGAYVAARQRLEAELPRLHPESSPVLRARVLTLLAAMYMRRADVDPARRAYQEAMSLAEKAGDVDVLAHAYAGRGVVEATERDYEASLADFGRARVLCEKAGNVLGIAQVDMNMGSIMDIRGQPAAASRMLEDAARRLQALSSQEEWAVALQSLASAKLNLLDAAGALQAAESFSPPQASIANERLRWLLATTYARTLVANGRLDEAERTAEVVSEAASAPEDGLFRAHANAALALVAQARGNWEQSARLAREALTRDLERADVLVFLQTWQLSLAGLQRSGRIDLAKSETSAYVAWLEAFPVDRSAALARFAEAEQARAEGRTHEAIAGYATAFARAERLGLPKDIVSIGSRYVDLLMDTNRADEAAAVLGRLTPWSQRDSAVSQLQRRIAESVRATVSSEAAKP